MLCYFSINLKIYTFALLLSIIIIYFVVVRFYCTLDFFFVIFRTFKKRKNENEIYVRNSFRCCDDG